VVGLANASTGALVSTTAYSPWGVIRATTGTEKTDLGFQSDPTDIDTGFVDMTTRNYSPGLGRFLTEDVLFGDPMDPTSLNQFIYGQGGPVTYTDPTGMYIVGEAPGACATHSDPIKGNQCSKNSAAYHLNSDGVNDPIDRSQVWELPDNPINDPERMFRDTVAFVRFISGFDDFKECFQGSGSGCGWALAGILPFGKFGKLARLGRASRAISHLDDFSDAGRVLDRGGYTAAGRELTKHATGQRGPSRFPVLHGGPSEINELAQSVLDDILTDPGTIVQPGYRGRFGDTLEFLAPSGRGAVYDPSGQFLFFIEWSP
jgi:RHS repeat-associated protein